MIELKASCCFFFGLVLLHIGHQTPSPQGVWHLETDLRFGGLDMAEFTISTVVDMEVDYEGAILILGRGEKYLHIFSPQGEPLGSFGRNGEGPGEFRSPAGLSWKGDSLAIRDPRLNRVSFFSAQGTFLDSFGFTVGGMRLGTPAADGSVISSTTAPISHMSQGLVSSHQLLSTSRDGTILDTIAIVPVENQSLSVGRFNSVQPFSDSPLVSPAWDGRTVWMVDRRPREGESGSLEWMLLKIDLEGDTVFARAIPTQTEKVSDVLVEQYVKGVEEVLEDRGASMAVLGISEKTLKEVLYLPEYLPPIKEILPGRDGTLWVLQNPANGTTADWSVFNENGELLASLESPHGMKVLCADKEFLWGYELDEWDVPEIVRYRVVPAPAEGRRVRYKTP